MSRFAAILAALTTIFSIQALAGAKRQLGPHEHGHGALNIAIEDRQITMELAVPGADIVGFEHPASNAEDKGRINSARNTLAAPLDLFMFPATAECAAKSDNVTLAGETHHEHEDKAEAGSGNKNAHKVDEHAGQGDESAHSEFHVEYTLVCKNVGAIDRITFHYFEVFPRAEELNVRMITGKGQRAYEVTRDNPVIDIRGMI